MTRRWSHSWRRTARSAPSNRSPRSEDSRASGASPSTSTRSVRRGACRSRWTRRTSTCSPSPRTISTGRRAPAPCGRGRGASSRPRSSAAGRKAGTARGPRTCRRSWGWASPRISPRSRAPSASRSDAGPLRARSTSPSRRCLPWSRACAASRRADVRLFLFDIDGTLLIARGAGRAAFRQALERTYGTAGALDVYDLRGKTDPRIVWDVLTAAGVPGEAIEARLGDRFEAYVRELATIIGDTPHDVDCARACGAVAVAVATGQYPPDELAACAPDLLFRDFSDVAYALAALTSCAGRRHTEPVSGHPPMGPVPRPPLQ